MNDTGEGDTLKKKMHDGEYCWISVMNQIRVVHEYGQ